jgi:GrpB-like predicted nucleotidyltransferase (UPF0157 family)
MKLIQAYQKSWIDDFQRIREVIQPTLDAYPTTIEHIGSTSVPGLAAKAIIDIDIAFNPPASFEEIRVSLENIGYFHNGNQGIADREVFKRNPITVSHPVLDTIVHHLYVCPANSKELKKHLLFRDYLRKNMAVRDQYQQLKYKIASEAADDRKKYAALKEIKAKNFIHEILVKAEKEMALI